MKRRPVRRPLYPDRPLIRVYIVNARRLNLDQYSGVSWLWRVHVIKAHDFWTTLLLNSYSFYGSTLLTKKESLSQILSELTIPVQFSTNIADWTGVGCGFILWNIHCSNTNNEPEPYHVISFLPTPAAKPPCPCGYSVRSSTFGTASPNRIE
jgi:hypothetical protein